MEFGVEMCRQKVEAAKHKRLNIEKATVQNQILREAADAESFANFRSGLSSDVIAWLESLGFVVERSNFGGYNVKWE